MYDSQGNQLVMPFDAPRGVSPSGGKTYFVNATSGNNNYEGTDPEFPLADLDTAYGKAVTGKGDYIFVQRFVTWDLTTLVTTPPLTIAKNGIHLIGLGSGGWDNGLEIYGAAHPAILLGDWTSIGFELAGFNLGNDGSAPAIRLAGTAYRANIHHCSFGKHYAGVEGIGPLLPGTAGELSHSTVDHCVFSGGLLTGHGIGVSGVNAIISNSLFERIREKGIYFLAGGDRCYILDNKFYSPDDDGEAAGWAIHLIAATRNCVVMGNKAASRGSASTNNPYRDQTAAAAADMLNGWSDNFDGEALSGGPDGA